MERDLFELKPRTEWIGTRLDVHRELDSTNLRAEELAASGAPEGTLVIADAQTAGRGRMGRSFWSPGGRSLYMSLLLRPALAAEQVHLFIFAAAVAVAETARIYVPAGVNLEIKWPNDVLLDGRKTSGINLPAQMDGDRVASAVLGIGLNVNLCSDEVPEELEPIVTSLRIASGRAHDRVEVAEELLARLETRIDRIHAGDFQSVLDAWQNDFQMKGARVRIGGPGVPKEFDGVVEGIGADGALLLDRNGMKERVLAGDVTLLRD